jgi:hypothetical protein
VLTDLPLQIYVSIMAYLAIFWVLMVELLESMSPLVAAPIPTPASSLALLLIVLQLRQDLHRFYIVMPLILIPLYVLFVIVAVVFDILPVPPLFCTVSSFPSACLYRRSSWSDMRPGRGAAKGTDQMSVRARAVLDRPAHTSRGL